MAQVDSQACTSRGTALPIPVHPRPAVAVSGRPRSELEDTGYPVQLPSRSELSTGPAHACSELDAAGRPI